MKDTILGFIGFFVSLLSYPSVKNIAVTLAIAFAGGIASWLGGKLCDMVWKIFKQRKIHNYEIKKQNRI